MVVVSSCRECWVKSRNERLVLVAIIQLGTLRLPVLNRRKGGDDVKSSPLYDLGYVLQWIWYNELRSR